jgi:hypothetical protein
VPVQNLKSTQRVVAGLRTFIKCLLLNPLPSHWANNSSPTLLQFSVSGPPNEIEHGGLQL